MPSILVIDDDEVLLSLLRAVLQDAGYAVLATADGPLGIELFVRRRPDLVILDLALPSMHGLDVLRALTASRPGARILVLSGYGAAETVHEARRLGAQEFLQKPVLNEELLAAIRRCLPGTGVRSTESEY